MNDTDLDRALREMLARRAGDIHSVPDHVSSHMDDDVIDLGLHRRDVVAVARRRWPLLVAAAVVLAAAAGVLAAVLPNSGQNGTPPADHRQHAPLVSARKTCAAADPDAWKRAVRAASFTPAGVDPAQPVIVDGVTASGAAVVEYHPANGPSGDLVTDLGVIPAGSRTVQYLSEFSGGQVDRSKSFELDVDRNGRDAVVSVETGPLNGPDTVQAIYGMNLNPQSGYQANLETAGRQPDGTLGRAYVQNGTAYWQVDSVSGKPSEIFSEPVSGGIPKLVARGDDLHLARDAAGLGWNPHGPVSRPVGLPKAIDNYFLKRAYETGTHAGYFSFVSDGANYAWRTGSGALQWYGARGQRIVSLPGLLGVPGASKASPLAVFGPFVVFRTQSGDSSAIVDTRTGAMLSLPTDGIAGFHGVGVGAESGTGTPGGNQFVLLDSGELPALRC